MCVAIPGKVVWIGSRAEPSIPARIDVGGQVVPTDLAMVPEASVGDYVVAHSGYAIRIVDPATAQQVRGQLGIVN